MGWVKPREAGTPQDSIGQIWAPFRSQHRAARVAALLHRELAQLLRCSVRDPRFESVSIVRVEVTRDLSLARVFLEAGALSGEPLSLTKAQLRSLMSAIPFLRKSLAGRMGLRRVPRLTLHRSLDVRAAGLSESP